MKAYIPALFLLTALAGCGPSRPHPKDHKALIQEDDSIQGENIKSQLTLKDLTKTYEEGIDSVPDFYTGKILACKKLTNEMLSYLHQVQIELLVEADGIESSKATMMGLKNLEHPTNTDIPFRYFLGGSAVHPNGKAVEIKEKLNQFKAKLLEQLDEKRKSVITLGLITSDTTTAYDNKKKNWEAASFEGLNNAEAFVYLDQLQNEVLNAGTATIEMLEKADVEL